MKKERRHIVAVMLLTVVFIAVQIGLIPRGYVADWLVFLCWSFLGMIVALYAFDLLVYLLGE